MLWFGGLSLADAAVMGGGAFVGPGPELLLNGGMDSDTVWAHNAGITIAGGVASWAGTATGMNQPVAFVVGGVYRTIFTVTAFTAGAVRVRFLGGTTVNGLLRSTVDTFQQDIVAVAGNNLFDILGATSPTLSVDNVQCFRIG